MGWGIVAIVIGIGAAIWTGNGLWLIVCLPAMPLLGFVISAARRS